MRPATAFLSWAIAIFIWIYLIPILIVGFVLCIPFFLIISPVLVFITATILYLLKDEIFTGSSIRQLIANMPYTLWFGNIDKINLPKQPALITSHPHGFLCTGIIVSTHFAPDSNTILAVSPWIFTIPIVGWMAKHVGCIPATEKQMLNALKKSSVIIVPGGVPELVSHEMYTRRHGFIRIAQKANVPILPIITQTTFYDHISLPFRSWRVYIAKQYGIPLMVPPLGWCWTWIPKPKPVEMKQLDLFQDISNNIENTREKYYDIIKHASL